MRKATLLVLGALTVAVIGILLTTLEKPVAAEYKKLGYCPTMKGLAESLQQNNPGIELVRKGSSAEVLDSLNRGEVDIALVGRLARSSETDAQSVRRLSAGYTIVSATPRNVDLEELQFMEVHTAVDRLLVAQLLPSSVVVYHDSTAEALKHIEEAVLISWDEFADEHELVTVTGPAGKVMAFRLPVLYSREHDVRKA
jgi:hypothetical protein